MLRKLGAIALSALALLFFGFILAIPAARVVDWTFVEPVFEQMKSEHEHYWPMVERDMSLVAREPFFAEQRKGEDAGPFLNPRTWRAGDAPAAVELPPAVSAALADWGDAWPSHYDDPLVTSVDLTWMSELGRFGYWSFCEKYLGQLPADTPYHELPLPDVGTLVGVAKLRLLAGRLSGELERARVEVRDLAYLASTTPSAVVAEAAVALLRADTMIVEAVEQGGTPVNDGPRPVSREVLDVAERVIVARAFAGALPAAPAGLTGGLSDAPLGPAGCAALAESIQLAATFKLGPVRRIAPVIAALDRALAAHAEACHLDPLLREWRDDHRLRERNLLRDLVRNQSWLTRVGVALAEIHPWTRETLFSAAYVTSMPDPYARYREIEAQSN